MHEHTNHIEVDTVELPSPTAMPMILSFGVALILTGLVTNIVVGLLGFLLALWGGIGWFFQVLPQEQHSSVKLLRKRSVSSARASLWSVCRRATCIGNSPDRDVSNQYRSQGRNRRRSRDDNTCGYLRFTSLSQYLVPGKPAGRWWIRAVDRCERCLSWRISYARSACCYRHPRSYVNFGRTSLWRDAADVSEISHCYSGASRSANVHRHIALCFRCY